MNIAKFLKGCTTITELMNMPNRYLHTLYKQYVEMIMDKDKSEQHGVEQMQDELEDAMGGY